MKIRTVILGMGKMGKIRYDALKKHAGFEIVALCENNLENCVDYSEKVYSDWKVCLEETKPEAIIVCTFNDVIPDIVCYGLENGMDVFSEKPPGRTLEDAIRMMEVQKKTEKVLKFGFNHRMHNSVIEAKALMESKILGDVVCIRGIYGKAGSENFSSEWRNDLKKSGGGILLDQGIHMLDLICHFTESSLTVKNARVDNLVWKELDTEDSALAVFETEKKQIISFHSSAIQWKHKFDMDIICTNGYIALNGILTATQSYGEETITYYKKDLQAKSGKVGKPKEHTMCFDSDQSWDLEIEEFYDAVKLGKGVKNGTPSDAVRVMKIISEIYSLAERKEYQVD